MMKKCWEMVPEDRPSFKKLYKSTSKYIERTTGYLEVGYNPFSVEKGKSTAEEKENEKSEKEELNQQ